jgi:hypothetical protein
MMRGKRRKEEGEGTRKKKPSSKTKAKMMMKMMMMIKMKMKMKSPLKKGEDLVVAAPAFLVSIETIRSDSWLPLTSGGGSFCCFLSQSPPSASHWLAPLIGVWAEHPWTMISSSCLVGMKRPLVEKDL